MKVSKTISHRAQYTALVDILFATIGVFVIVFALQDLVPASDLQPAPYDHAILCGPDARLTYMDSTGENEIGLDERDISSGRVADLLAAGGRVLVALGGDCLSHRDGDSIFARLRDLEEVLSDRPASDRSPLTLFEFAPLGVGDLDIDSIRQRFLAGRGA